MTKIDYNEKNQNAANEQEIRERKKPIIQDYSSPLNNNSTKNPVKINKVLIELKHKFSQQPVQYAAIGAFILFLIAALMLPHRPPSSFFYNFASTTNSIFDEINKVDLPAADAIMEHTVACRRAANMIQRSPAFERQGYYIAKGLRNFGEKIMEAGHLLQQMYSKGSSVYKSFDIEIEGMMNQLNSNYVQRGEARYFKERLNILITKIQEFRKFVERTHVSIHNAENARDDVERYIYEGLGDAEKFIADGCNGHNCHSVDISKAKKELSAVTVILDHLHNTADHLDKIEKILKVYEDKLMDISAELGKAGGDDGFFEVTKSDLKYLKDAVDNSKINLYRFNKKAQISY